MCLIMTAAAAAITGGIWLRLRRSGRAAKSLFTVTLAFAAAALMWCVDGIASVLGGGSFLDMSRSDAVLGAIVIACGLALLAVLSLAETLTARKGNSVFARARSAHEA